MSTNENASREHFRRLGQWDKMRDQPVDAALALPSVEAVTGPSDAAISTLAAQHLCVLSNHQLQAGDSAEVDGEIPFARAVLARWGSPPVAAPADGANFERMFNAACVDLGLINEALDLDPNDGGAAPILAAINELKSRAAPAAATTTSEAAVTEAPFVTGTHNFPDDDCDMTLRGMLEGWAKSARHTNWTGKEVHDAIVHLIASADSAEQEFRAALTPSQAHGKSEAMACTRCGGTGIVDDGEIDCFPNGEPYLHGPVKCVKDCPACTDRAQRPAAPADGAALANVRDLLERSAHALLNASFESFHLKTQANNVREEIAAALASAQGEAAPAPAGKYDEVLQPFVSLMERELHANAGKGDRPGWMSMSFEQLMLEIYYHAAKLQKALRDDASYNVGEHAADVANMAMMVADRYGLLDSVRALMPAAPRPAPAHPDAGSGVEFAGWQERHRVHGGEWSAWAQVEPRELEYRQRHARDNPHYNEIRPVFAASGTSQEGASHG